MVRRRWQFSIIRHQIDKNNIYIYIYIYKRTTQSRLALCAPFCVGMVLASSLHAKACVYVRWPASGTVKRILNFAAGVTAVSGNLIRQVNVDRLNCYTFQWLSCRVSLVVYMYVWYALWNDAKTVCDKSAWCSGIWVQAFRMCPAIIMVVYNFPLRSFA